MTSDAVIAEFQPPKESVGWAQEAISELRESIEAFFKSGVASFVIDVDPQSGENVYKIKVTPGLPKAFARKATEAITSTKHAFDQAVFAARNIVSGRSNKSIYYPWANSQVDLGHLLKSRGIDQRLWDTIKAHEPYPRSDAYAGGDDVLRALASIANDKHTVGLSINGNIASAGFPGILTGSGGAHVKIFAPRWDSKKNEAELLRWTTGSEMKLKDQYQVTFEVLLENSRLSHPVNAIGALTEFSMKANTVIETLKARCLELTASP